MYYLSIFEKQRERPSGWYSITVSLVACEREIAGCTDLVARQRMWGVLVGKRNVGVSVRGAHRGLHSSYQCSGSITIRTARTCFVLLSGDGFPKKKKKCLTVAVESSGV